jgi:hypothetical protein
VNGETISFITHPYLASIPHLHPSFPPHLLHPATSYSATFNNASSPQAWWSTTYASFIDFCVPILICFLAKPSKPEPGPSKRNNKNASSAPLVLPALPVPTGNIKNRKPSTSAQRLPHDEQEDDDKQEDNDAEDYTNYAFSQPHTEAELRDLYNSMAGPPGLVDGDSDSDENSSDDDGDASDGTLCLPLNAIPWLISYQTSTIVLTLTQMVVQCFYLVLLKVCLPSQVI